MGGMLTYTDAELWVLLSVVMCVSISSLICVQEFESKGVVQKKKEEKKRNGNGLNERGVCVCV